MSELDPRYWTLDADHNPVPTDDVLVWGAFFEKPDRIVATDEIGDVRISTVFLGLDHSFARMMGDKSEPPLLFETMIFGGVLDGYQERSATWKEAEQQHADACALVRKPVT